MPFFNDAGLGGINWVICCLAIIKCFMRRPSRRLSFTTLFGETDLRSILASALGLQDTLLRIAFLALIFNPLAVWGQQNSSLKILDAYEDDRGTVQVSVSVLDENGNPIKGLSKADFRPSVEGKPVGSFSVEPESSGKNPLSVILAIDVSGSMRGAPIAAAKEAAAAFVGQLPDEDSVALVRFGSDVKDVAEFTSNKTALKESLEGLVANEKTTWLYAATIECLRIAKNAPTSRVAIVLLTDGKDEGSPQPEEEALERVKDVPVPIFTLGFGPNVQTDYLEKVADASSGGSFISAPTVAEIGRVYEKVSDQLRNEYRIEFPFAQPAGDYVATLAVNYRGMELSGSRRFAHAYVGGTPPMRSRWLDSWLVRLLFIGLVILVTLSLIMILTRWRSRGFFPGALEAQVEMMIEGKRHPLSAVAGGDDGGKTFVAQIAAGDAGLIVDLPSSPVHFLLVDEPSGKSVQEVILTRFDKKSTFRKEKLYLLISDRSVSRPDGQRYGHAVVFLDQNSGRYMIEDLGSIGGSYLHNVRISRAMNLENGDSITLGTVSLRYYDTRSTGDADPSARDQKSRFGQWG